MSVKHFVLVFLAEVDNSGKFVDPGNDPCFDRPPSWGICRPDIRNEKGLCPGSYLLFIACVKINGTRKYYLKGYFCVKEKIDVISAYNGFCGRSNVIISSRERKIPNEVWASKRWEQACFENNQSIPEFMKRLKQGIDEYYQTDWDNHQIDNWKCRRIYNCNIKSFKKCIAEDRCLKDAHNLKKNYVVGSENDYAEWDNLMVEWRSVSPMIDKPSELMVGNRHPELEISLQDFLVIKNHMESL